LFRWLILKLYQSQTHNWHIIRYLIGTYENPYPVD
jgi:hypothetical protein